METTRHNNEASSIRRWGRALAVTALTTGASLGMAGAVHGQDIPPWVECVNPPMPAAVDFGGIAAPNLVFDDETQAVLLQPQVDDPACAIYELPAGI